MEKRDLLPNKSYFSLFTNLDTGIKRIGANFHIK